MKKLSIVVPAYNAAGCLGRCLESILDQDYHDDIEVIVVNDGSTDDTASIAAMYQSQRPDVIRVITKENGGLPSARNAGMDVAQGEWIWFCDSDDYIKKNGLSYVLDHFVDDSIDLCTFSSITLDPIALKTFSETDEVTGRITFEGSTIDKYEKEYPTFVWDHLYRLDAISDVRFRNVAMCEDVVFNLDVYMKNLRLRCTKTSVYRYTVSETQLTRKRDKKTMRWAVQGYESLFELARGYQQSSPDEELKMALEKMISYQFTPFMSRALSAGYTGCEFKELMQRLKRKGLFPVQEFTKRDATVNRIGKLTALYPIESWLFRKIFVPYVLPRLSRN